MFFGTSVFFLWVLSMADVSFWPKLLQPTAYAFPLPALVITEVSLACRNCFSGPFEFSEAQKGDSSGDSEKATFFFFF